jgi:transcriptional regulator with GAF, ATPase, and Fis domain
MKKLGRPKGSKKKKTDKQEFVNKELDINNITALALGQVHMIREIKGLEKTTDSLTTEMLNTIQSVNKSFFDIIKRLQDLEDRLHSIESAPTASNSKDDSTLTN